MTSPCDVRKLLRLLLSSLFLLVVGHSPLVTVLSAQGGGPPGAIVYTLAIDPANPSTLYAGTTLGRVFKSTNGGASWSGSSTSLGFQDVLVLAIDPSDPETIYAGAEFDGVWKSTDGGASWTKEITGMGILSVSSVSALVIDPTCSPSELVGQIGSNC